ncbi:MAG: succinyl-diaminopimelate desuccinylase [Neisseriaceae bacterium]
MLTTNESERLLELTQNLIGFKSITPNDAGCLDFIQEYLSELGFKFVRVNRNDTSNLIATYGDITNLPIFAFAGHIDVVPPGDVKKWETDPFVLEEKDNHLYGRGIADMKGAIASFIIACENYIESKPDDKAIVILLTSDEEGSGIDGTPVIVDYLKEKNIRIKHCIVGEPSSIDIVGDVIKVGRRGSITGGLELYGKQGHVAYPHLCENPIHLFASAMAELTSIKWDNGNEYFPPTSFQFTNINSGLGVDNVIPGILRARFNFRYNELQTLTSIRDKVIAILNKYSLQYQLTWTNSAKPFRTKDGKLNSVTINAIKQIMNIEVEKRTDGGTSDGRFLVEVCDELLELGLSSKYIHQVSEHIPKSDLVNLANVYNLILKNI